MKTKNEEDEAKRKKYTTKIRKKAEGIPKFLISSDGIRL